MSGDVLRVEGTVTLSAHSIYKVRVDLGGKSHEITARCGGFLRERKIWCMPGDRVVVELSPYDLTRGRIVERERAVK